MQQKAIEIAHHGRTVYGTICLPETEGEKVPAVVISHGFRGRGDDFEDMAKLLAEHGIAAVYYDFPGGSSVSNPTMKTTQMSVFTEKEDLCAVLRYVRQLPQVDAEKIFAFGESQGGLVTALTAEESADGWRGMILLYPALCIPDDWRRKFPRVEDIPKTYELWDFLLGKIYFEDIRELDVLETIGSFSKDVLIMHGDADEIVPLSYSREAAEKYGHANLVVFPGEGHGFGEEGGQRMSQLVLEFVKERI